MKYIVALAFFLTSTLAFSESMYCEGKEEAVYIQTNGDVLFKGSYAENYTKACNLKGSSSVDTVTCSLWSSYLATAVKDQVPFKTKYTVTADAPNCEGLPAYSYAPVPIYIMLKAPKVSEIN